MVETGPCPHGAGVPARNRTILEEENWKKTGVQVVRNDVKRLNQEKAPEGCGGCLP